MFYYQNLNYYVVELCCRSDRTSVPMLSKRRMTLPPRHPASPLMRIVMLLSVARTVYDICSVYVMLCKRAALGFAHYCCRIGCQQDRTRQSRALADAHNASICNNVAANAGARSVSALRQHFCGPSCDATPPIS